MAHLQMIFPIKPPFIMDFPVRYVSHYQRVSWKFCATTWTGGWLPMEWFVVYLIIEFPKNLAGLLQIVEICEVKGEISRDCVVCQWKAQTCNWEAENGAYCTTQGIQTAILVREIMIVYNSGIRGPLVPNVRTNPAIYSIFASWYDD